MRRLALAVFLVVTLCGSAHATYLKHMYDWVTSRYGNAISGATVYVYGANTTTTATIYSDLAGGTVVTSCTTDADGYWECYIDPKTRVDVRIYHAAWAIDETIPNWGGNGANADTTDISATSGDLTVDGSLIPDRMIVVPIRGALPDTATAMAYGNGLFYFRHFDTGAAKACTLFYWDDADTIYHYWTQDGTQAAP